MAQPAIQVLRNCVMVWIILICVSVENVLKRGGYARTPSVSEDTKKDVLTIISSRLGLF